MATLKASTAPQITLANAASVSNHAIRKAEYDAAIAAVPTTSAMNAAIAAAGHAAVTVGFGYSLAGIVLTGQELSGDVTLIPDSSSYGDNLVPGGAAYNDDGTYGITVVSGMTYHWVKGANDTDITIGANNRSTTGDIVADGTNAVLTGLFPGSPPVGDTITATLEQVIPDGSGLQIISTGLGADWGVNHNQIARGDHTHTDLHPAATAMSSASVTMSIDDNQAVAAAVILASSSGLSILDDGLAVDYTAVAHAAHSHSNATTGAAGFMSAADKIALNALAAGVAITVANTDSVQLNLSVGKVLTANVAAGVGLTINATTHALEIDTSVLDTLYIPKPANTLGWRINAVGQLQIWDVGNEDSPPTGTGYRTIMCKNGQLSTGPLETA